MNGLQLQTILRKHLEASVSEESFSEILSAMREAVEKGSIDYSRWVQQNGGLVNVFNKFKNALTHNDIYQEYLKTINP